MIQKMQAVLACLFAHVHLCISGPSAHFVTLFALQHSLHPADIANAAVLYSALQEQDVHSSLKGQLAGLKLQLAAAQSRIAELQNQLTDASEAHSNTKQKHEHLWQSQLLQQQNITHRALANEQLHQQLLQKQEVQRQQQQEHEGLVSSLQESKQAYQQLSKTLQLCKEQHEQELKAMAHQLTSTSACLRQAEDEAHLQQRLSQVLHQQHEKQQLVREKQQHTSQHKLLGAEQQLQQLQDKAKQQSMDQTNINVKCEQLVRDLSIAHADRQKANDAAAALQSQLLSSKARAETVEAAHEALSLHSNAEKQQQQHQIEALQCSLAASLASPKTSSTAVQTSTCIVSAEQGSQTEAMVVSQPPAGALTAQIQSLQVCLTPP